MSDPRRSIPSVDSLLASAEFGPLLQRYPRSRVVEAARGAQSTPIVPGQQETSASISVTFSLR